MTVVGPGGVGKTRLVLETWCVADVLVRRHVVGRPGRGGRARVSFRRSPRRWVCRTPRYGPTSRRTTMCTGSPRS
ncbi:hypothetical protein ACRAWF_15205 [Streptomyces sp. L7]